MAIFNNSDVSNRGNSTDANTTIITAGAKIKGEIELSCNLYIDGELEGSINSSKEINVGKNGHVKGDIFTNKLIVQGYIEGRVEAERVEIKATGHVNGEITSVELVIESKGVFEGTSVLKNGSQQAVLENISKIEKV
jgi:cytoskeletal protein CcmA (bactofilin family)